MHSSNKKYSNVIITTVISSIQNSLINYLILKNNKLHEAEKTMFILLRSNVRLG